MACPSRSSACGPATRAPSSLTGCTCTPGRTTWAPGVTLSHACTEGDVRFCEIWGPLADVRASAALRFTGPDLLVFCRDGEIRTRHPLTPRTGEWAYSQLRVVQPAAHDRWPPAGCALASRQPGTPWHLAHALVAARASHSRQRMASPHGTRRCAHLSGLVDRAAPDTVNSCQTDGSKTAAGSPPALA